ncbi:MAG: DUF4340 domain-containing protein [Planctomycetaceae bacterium]
MNPSSRTMAFAATAVVTGLMAWLAHSATQPSAVPGFGEIGQKFFPEFDDVEKVTALTVGDYDEGTLEGVSFAVKQNDDGLWVIPSHYNYPAEAKERLAKTATSLLDIKKTAIQSRSKDDWKRYGVIDPASDGVGTAAERGTRLTLSDGSGNPVVDLIVGNKVEGRDKYYYVREPEKDTTYITELDIDLSAKFSDWIETDLLKITTSDIVDVVVDNYSIDEASRAIEMRDRLEFSKEGYTSSGKWQLEGLNAETEELDNSPVTSIVSSLDQLKIVGVRPKPEGLNKDLRLPPQLEQALRAELEREMRSRGFFVAVGPDDQERLASNEGELIAGTGKGVQYTLYFGEIARGSEKDIETGLNGESEKKDEATGDQADGKTDTEKADDADISDDKEKGPRRYLLVKVDFNEKLLGPKPEAPQEPVKPEILNTQEEKSDAAETNPADEKAAENKEAAPAEQKETAAEDAGSGDEDELQEDESADEETSEESPADDKTEAGKPEPAAEEKPATETKDPAADAGSDPEKNDKPAQDAPAETDGKQKDKTDAAESKPAAAGDRKPADEKPAEPAVDPKKQAQEEYDKAMKAFEAAKKAHETSLSAFEKKVEDGKKAAEELDRRFAKWYYVISSDSFEKFRITRTDVIKKKEQKPEGDAAEKAPADK